MPEKQGVIYHEWCHIALFHPRRLLNRILRHWNVSCDFSINCHIVDDVNESKMKLAPGMLYDPYYRGWNSESIYEDLMQAVSGRAKELQDGAAQKYGAEESNSSSQKNSADYCNREKAIEMLALDKVFSDVFSEDMLPAPDCIDQEDKEFRHEIVKAAEIHKKYAKNNPIPGFYEKYINKIKRSTVAWEHCFANVWSEVVQATDDRGYSRLKRWGLPFNLLLPSDIGTQKIDVVFICDTSGSHYQISIFERFASELSRMLPHVNKMTLIGADCKVQEKATITNIQQLVTSSPIKRKFNFKGGGGTDFRPALLEASKSRADLVIYYTDGFGTFGTVCPRGITNLLWVLTTDESSKPPFGKFILISE